MRRTTHGIVILLVSCLVVGGIAALSQASPSQSPPLRLAARVANAMTVTEVPQGSPGADKLQLTGG
ncbi:MAG: hypothetical protein FWD55_04150, partial [Propionibacteriaceae bacterium]|nr:hypothetical protein [Propionibacteriaceae bacterium]